MIALILALALSTPADEPPTAPFRREHVEVREHLAHIDAMLAKLPAASPAEQRTIMTNVPAFLHEHIRKHAEWEEAKLYPAVDRRTHVGPPSFTASMRHEHRIVGRSIDELAAMAKTGTPDIVAFTRAAHRLLGLISAHFEEEEEVLLPILDKTMSKKQFEEELGLSH
jgi:hemerythrin-like domain-containing protein